MQKYYILQCNFFSVSYLHGPAKKILDCQQSSQVSPTCNSHIVLISLAELQ